MKPLIKLSLISLLWLWLAYGTYTLTAEDQEIINYADSRIDEIIEVQPEKKSFLYKKIKEISMWNFSERIKTIFWKIFEKWQASKIIIVEENASIFTDTPWQNRWTKSKTKINGRNARVQWLPIENTEDYQITKENKKHDGSTLLRIKVNKSPCTHEYWKINKQSDNITLEKLWLPVADDEQCNEILVYRNHDFIIKNWWEINVLESYNQWTELANKWEIIITDNNESKQNIHSTFDAQCNIIDDCPLERDETITWYISETSFLSSMDWFDTINVKPNVFTEEIILLHRWDNLAEPYHHIKVIANDNKITGYNSINFTLEIDTKVKVYTKHNKSNNEVFKIIELL